MKNIIRKIHNFTHPVLGRILMLHRVVEQRSDGDNRELEITPEFLKRTIENYRQQGYQFVSIDKAYDIITRGRNNRPFVCLTFDDGYQDNYDIAYPILKQLEVPFAIYVTTEFIDNRIPMWWYPNEKLGISTESLKELDADPLCTIGAHTVSHPKLDSLTREEQYKEIADSKQLLETILDHEVKHFSFPHGTHNDDTLAICRELGFQTVVQSWGGPVRRWTHYDVLPRINITEP